MTSIVPAVLVKNEDAFNKLLVQKDVQDLAPLWQIDILDGSMFGQESWADPKVIGDLENLPNIELHLMVNNPLPIIKEWEKQVENLKRVILHAEIPHSLIDIMHDLEQFEVERGIALAPETSLDVIESIKNDCEIILILGVHGGKSGEKFLGESILKKIIDAKKRFPTHTILVDGGVTLENARKIIDAGADQLCISSAIWKSKNPAKATQDFLST